MQQIAHRISSVEGGSQTLAAIGYIPSKAIATIKDFSKDVAKKYLPEQWYQGLSEFYQGLPKNSKVTLTLTTDSMVLWGAGRILQIASGSATSKLYSALEKGVAAEASAFTTVGKASEIGLVGENILTKPLSMLTKVEHKLPTAELGEPSIALSSTGYQPSTIQKHIELTTGVEKIKYPQLEKYTASLKQYENWSQLPELVKKVPEEFGMPNYNKNMGGLRWQEGGNSIRIDKGNPSADYPTERVDHVAITYNGKVVDHTGKNYIMYDSKTNSMYKIRREDFEKGYNNNQFYWFEIDRNPNFIETAKHPDAHIPADHWVKWKSFYKPE